MQEKDYSLKYNESGVYYLSFNEKELAIHCFEKSIEHNPPIAEPYIKLYELQEHKDIDLIYKSIEVEPTKWAYFHLFYYYFNKKDFEKLNDSFVDMMDFFEKTNYVPTEDENKIIASYFGHDFYNSNKNTRMSIPYLKLYELQEHKDIDLIYKSIEVEPTKWAYFHLFYYYFNKKDFENLNSSYLEMMSFFEKTNYKPTEEDKNTINSYFGQEPAKDSDKLSFIKNNPIQIKNPLRIIPNHLECVVLLLTGNELKNGYYNHFLKQIESTIKDTNKYFSKKLDFKIITNKNKKIDAEPLHNLFNSVEIIQSKIPKEYDFYLKHEDEIDGQNLKYGLKSGPNYIFFESFEHLTQYNTTLFLECDCFFGEDWLEKVYNYTRFSGGFWISGAVYDGVNLHGKHTIINEHINGGVALYATGNSLFLEFLQFCWSNFSFFIEQENNLPYDFYIKQIIDDYYNFSSSRELMNFINRQYLFNNLIFNYSTEQEQETAEQLIVKKYNYAILHKKPSDQKEIYNIKVDEEFDSDFYYSEYPFVHEYYLKYCKENNIPDRIRAYHHYLNFGIESGFFKNKNEKNNKFDNSFLRSFNLNDI